MKTKDELNALKEEVETVNRKLAELDEEELAQIAGGVNLDGTEEKKGYNVAFFPGLSGFP